MASFHNKNCGVCFEDIEKLDTDVMITKCNHIFHTSCFLPWIHNIENKFKIEGKKIAIGYGNWSMNSQMKNFFSTPNQGFRKLINSRFLTITVD